MKKSEVFWLGSIIFLSPHVGSGAALICCAILFIVSLIFHWLES